MIFNEEKKYLNISEISRLTKVPEYTLRYWEKEFKSLSPERRAGIRKYSAKDVDLINKIKELLYDKKMTIKGAKKVILGDKRRKADSDVSVTDSKVLSEIKKDLEELLTILKK